MVQEIQEKQSLGNYLILEGRAHGSYEYPDILIAQDDIDLLFGKLRLSTNSGSAGHKGAASVITSVGRGVPRLRIGIEHRGDKKNPDTESYVLQNFTPQERKELSDKIIPEAVAEIEKFIGYKNIPQ